MTIREVCEEALGICVDHLREIESQISPAQWVPWENSHNWRFVEQHPDQILVQKLARYITGLKAIDILLRAGFLQEVGVLFRMLDEIGEDISFVALGLITGCWTKNHVTYAQYFWSEDDKNGHPPVRRKTIRAFVNRALGQADPSTADGIARTIYKIYSDYVHARSAPIMGMMHGPPPELDVNGILNEKARFPYVEQAPSYFYRGMVSASFAAKAVLSEERAAARFADFSAFEKAHSELLFLNS